MAKRRWEILTELLPNNRDILGAEIGVFEGDTSGYLLKHLPRLTLIAVDPFEHYPEHTATLKPNKKKFYGADFDKVMKRFWQNVFPHTHRVDLIKKYSKYAAAEIDDKSLDFVFIDGNHAYEFVKEDILLWGPKVKPGGVLAGHDWNVKGYKNRFGVNKAVEEIFNTDFAAKRHVWSHVVHHYDYFRRN